MIVTRVKEWFRHNWSLAVAVIVIPASLYQLLPTSIGGTESSVSFYWLYLSWRLRTWFWWFDLLWLMSFFFLFGWSARRRMRFRVGAAVSFVLVQLLVAWYVNQHCEYMFPPDQYYAAMCDYVRIPVYIWVCAACFASLLFFMSMLLARWRIPVGWTVLILAAISLSVLPATWALRDDLLEPALAVSVVALLLALGLMLFVHLHARVSGIALVLVLLAVFVATLALPQTLALPHVNLSAAMRAGYRGHVSSAWWPDGHVYHLAFEGGCPECSSVSGSYLLYKCDPTGLVCELVARVISRRYGWHCFDWIPSSALSCIQNDFSPPWQGATLQITPDGKTLQVMEGCCQLYTLNLNH